MSKNNESILHCLDSMYKEVEDVRMSIINIRISVAKLSHLGEAIALDAVSDYIEHSMIDLEKKIKELKCILENG